MENGAHRLPGCLVAAEHEARTRERLIHPWPWHTDQQGRAITQGHACAKTQIHSRLSSDENLKIAELNLRGLTGATVLAILRHGEQVLVPSGHERIHAGDVLAIAGSEEAIAAAREVIEPTTATARA